MASKKIVVVTGATGGQGGSVAKFLLDDGTYAVRAITRNPDSPAAKDLAARGAEVVKADLTNLESVEKAFAGAYGVFGITNFWEPGVGYDGEISQGKLLVDAAKASGIKHFVLSTLDSSEYNARHWESKNVIDQYLQKSGVPRTSLYTTFYFENFAGMYAPKKCKDGSYEIPAPLLPDAPFAIFSVADTGAFALAAFLHPEEWIGKDMRVASEFLTVRTMAADLSDVSGKIVHIKEVDAEAWPSFRGTDALSDEMHDKYVPFIRYILF
ncbi:hypothetical protein JB92DRAFT_2746124 [Gautieria morchelliformis]|nr:hypothetical protein JB92DRAFT_2746124 [Gautieria morchelliformis]